MKHTETIDVRILSLKRLDTLFAPNRNIKEIGKYGRFISLNNYHYIDIDPLPDNGQATLQSAYEMFTRRRDASDLRVHILQNMILFGNDVAFWQKTSQLLYITMVQLSNHCEQPQGKMPLDRESFEAEVMDAFDRAGIEKGKWCIYYSLEFCDAVLFAADSDFSRYQEALWNLSVRPGKNERHMVEDTISIYGVSAQAVRSSFRKFSAGKIPTFPPKAGRSCFDVSMLLGVQNANAWQKLYNKLTDRYKEKAAVFFHKKFGRSDVSVDFKGVDLDNVLYIAYLVFFGSCEGDCVDYRFGSCVISPRSPFNGKLPQEDLAEGHHDTLNEDSFSSIAEKTMTILYNNVIGRLKKLYAPLGGYIAEIHRSLLALLKQGFSEEYYISVLPSYISFLKFIRESLDDIAPIRGSKNNNWQVQVDLIIDLLREYYRALTLLDHSTIHDEKKFIQAPALNAFVCQIPPKLLAMYTAVASRITERLCDKDGEDLHRYSFLFVPDFRKDVYSRTISLSQASSNQVGIIYLEERLFYEPAITIPILIHEIAHKVGHCSRHRDMRAKSIFYCIATYLLFKSIPSQASALFDRMSVILAEALYADFKQKVEDTPYLERVNSFIMDSCACGLTLLNPSFTDRLLDAWQNDEQLTEQLSLFFKDQSNSYSDEQINVNRRTWSDGALYRRILQYIYEYYDDESQRANLALFCKCIRTSFSEAYSDLRMLETIGINGKDGTDTVREYHRLLSVMFKRRDCGISSNQNIIVSYYLREEAVCKALSLPYENQGVYRTPPDHITDKIIRKSQDILVEYLKRCANDQHGADPQLQRYMNFENNDVLPIRMEIYQYRKKLKRYFETLIS